MRFSGFRTKTAVMVFAAAGATSAFGYWGYGELRAHQLRDDITALVTDASLRMQTALSAQLPPTTVENPAVLRRFYEHAEAVDAHFRKLNDENAALVADFANAADDYLLTSREILLRWASSQRYRIKLSGSIQVLQDHMRADDRTAAWISAAVRAKEQVEEDYRDYNRAVNALSTLLGTFPAARDKMSPHLDVALLTDENVIATARTNALAASAVAKDEMEKIRQLRTYR
jgi:hypothetical protein